MKAKFLVLVAGVAAWAVTWQPVVAEQLTSFGAVPISADNYGAVAAARETPSIVPVGGMPAGSVRVVPRSTLLSNSSINFQDDELDLASPCEAQADGPGCQELTCDTGCESGCGGPRFFVFGEFLELRARDARVAYAVAANPPVVAGAPNQPTVQIGPYAVVEPEWQSAFRAGAGWFIDDCSSVSVRYTLFESHEVDATHVTAPNVLRSLVRHPSAVTKNVAGDALQARAQQDIDFELIDADFRGQWRRCDGYALTWLAGIRYAKLDQLFRSRFENNGFETVATDIGFDGLGPRIGLEGERFLLGGMSIYGKSAASFVVGEFRSSYQTGGDAAPVAAATSWRSGKIVPILDLELGVAWTSPHERLRISSGYVISGWFNTVKTDEWIQAVQNNNVAGLGRTMTFDGFASRAEVRF